LTPTSTHVNLSTSIVTWLFAHGVVHPTEGIPAAHGGVRPAHIRRLAPPWPVARLITRLECIAPYPARRRYLCRPVHRADHWSAGPFRLSTAARRSIRTRRALPGRRSAIRTRHCSRGTGQARACRPHNRDR